MAAAVALLAALAVITTVNAIWLWLFADYLPPIANIAIGAAAAAFVLGRRV